MKHPLDRLWLALSSFRTTAVLTIALGMYVAVGAFVPQGREAMELLQVEGAVRLRVLAAWGLTDLLGSPWFRGLAALLLGNVLMASLRSFLGSSGGEESYGLPGRAPHEAEFSTRCPEEAPELLRDSLGAYFGGAPSRERVDGSRVIMSFDTGGRRELAPVVMHLGLFALIAGAAMAAEPAPRSNSVVRAILRVTDSRTGSVGVFDMAQNEPVQIFQWRANYTVRDYRRSKGALGPAVRIQRSGANPSSHSEFWVYRDAPPGFDARHRGGLVSFEAISMGRVPAPGHGLASRPSSVLLIAGLALLILGSLGQTRTSGRVWVDADGERVRLVGVPERAGDGGFARLFERVELWARSAV